MHSFCNFQNRGDVSRDRLAIFLWIKFRKRTNLKLFNFSSNLISKWNYHPTFFLPNLSWNKAVLWNRNYLLRFRFRLLKSFGSGSSSDFWKSYSYGSGSGSGSYFRKVPVPVPVPAPYLDHKKQIFQNKILKFFLPFT